MNIKVPKKHLEVFFLTLKGTEGVLTLAESRIRDHFMKSLIPELQTFEADRKTIYEKFCNKDEDGNPDLTNDQYKFSKEVQEEVSKELTTLFEEEVELTSPASLKEIVERSEYKPKVGEAEIIDEILAKL